MQRCPWGLRELLSRVGLFATPWTVAPQAALSVGFSRPDHWSGSPFPPLGVWRWGLNPCRCLLYPWCPPGSPGSHQSGRRSCVTLSHPEPVNNSQEQNHSYQNTGPVGIAPYFVTSCGPTGALLLNLTSFFSSPFFFCSLLPATRTCCHSHRRDRWHRIRDRKAAGEAGHARDHR